MKAIWCMFFAITLVGIGFSQEIKDRREDQQDRIANGVASGQLTAGETAKIERQESKLNGEIARDRAANAGHLTNNEKRQINAQQNKLSKEIYKDKHNAAVQRYGNNEVDKRRDNQQDRIANGIRSGELTAGEAARLENHESKINREVRTDRQGNDGKLSSKGKAQVNRQLNRESARIYDKKHNASVGPR